ncbi:MAG: hypothetical protein COV57_02180 [Candidatus Liptonbacteria bacterium CG11_big_fil_rev_8_21_14_0_20_35_14]|uniref:Uncharacterized protein n=1 Tax=Candidatus Liptonbacteria bacterium CG11_big_fil_rev_8_21_14_0_20_35_14 TaxID=1974634 RepID=A0A2H0N7L2_9BACT|nr:MAG: hypothetical protein COV57_02180 [Candidatus Liptonbacteria bacterium CG11_big_fil_rev_8_21_14_0_20_35_14]
MKIIEKLSKLMESDNFMLICLLFVMASIVNILENEVFQIKSHLNYYIFISDKLVTFVWGFLSLSIINIISKRKMK